jgi:hypothetical protein
MEASLITLSEARNFLLRNGQGVQQEHQVAGKHSRS